MYNVWMMRVCSIISQQETSVLILLAVDDGEGKYVLGDTYLRDQVPIFSMN